MNHNTITKELEKSLSLEGFPPEAKETIVAGLLENIMKRSVMDIIEILSEEEALEFETLLNQGELRTAIDFVTEKHPEIEEILAKTSSNVIEEYKEAL